MFADGLRRRFRDPLDRAVQTFPTFLDFRWNRYKMRLCRTLQFLRTACPFDLRVFRCDLRIDIGDDFQLEEFLSRQALRSGRFYDPVQLLIHQLGLGVVLPVFSIQLDDPPHAPYAFLADNHAVLVFQMLLVNDVTGKNILVHEHTVIHRNTRPNSSPGTPFKHRLLRAEAHDRFLFGAASEGFPADHNVRIVCGQRPQ